MYFEEAPLDIPVGMEKDLFVNRKGRFSLNCLVTGGYDHKIYDIVCNAPGSFHDASIYRLSQVKPYLESLYPRVYVVGDKAFALNDTMITPFKRNAANYNQDTKLFNIRHSGARMEMTECIYGIWKRRFPILKQLRVNLSHAITIVEATGILHNISLDWNDIIPRDLYPDAPDAMAQRIDENDFVVNNLRQEIRYQQGVQARQNLLTRTLQFAPTPAELRKLGQD